MEPRLVLAPRQLRLRATKRVKTEELVIREEYN